MTKPERMTKREFRRNASPVKRPRFSGCVMAPFSLRFDIGHSFVILVSSFVISTAAAIAWGAKSSDIVFPPTRLPLHVQPVPSIQPVHHARTDVEESHRRFPDVPVLVDGRLRGGLASCSSRQSRRGGRRAGHHGSVGGFGGGSH